MNTVLIMMMNPIWIGVRQTAIQMKIHHHQKATWAKSKAKNTNLEFQNKSHHARVLSNRHQSHSFAVHVDGTLVVKQTNVRAEQQEVCVAQTAGVWQRNVQIGNMCPRELTLLRLQKHWKC